MMKRQREVQKAEKAARKRAKRGQAPPPGAAQPVPTVRIADLIAAHETKAEDEK